MIENMHNMRADLLFECLKDKISDNEVFSKSNKVWITGTIENEFAFSYEYNNVKFYATRVSSKRRSGVADHIPVIITEFLYEKFKGSPARGKRIEIGGEFRSFPVLGVDGVKHLRKFVAVKFINEIAASVDDKTGDINAVFIEGRVRTKPHYRETPFCREITDFYIKVKRDEKREDLIPCIAWNKTAKYVCLNFSEGDKIRIYGRIQSREYFKVFSSEHEDGEVMETHEVSVWKVQKVFLK